MLVCYIGVATKMDRLASSSLGSVLDSLPWALSLLLKLSIGSGMGTGN